MALSVQTNNAAITALKNLNINNANMNQSLTRLSTGFRINSAADDASGFAVSSKLDAQTQRLKAASLNATQAQAMTKMADAGVNEIQNMISRIQVLATQASSANNAGELGKLDAERVKLESAIDKIANASNYNGVNLLNGVNAAAATNANTGTLGGTTTDVTAVNITTFTTAGLNNTYSIGTAADGVVTVTASSGATGAGTYSSGLATADTQSGTIVTGSAETNAKALITGATLSGFSVAGQGKTLDIKVDQFGAVQVLDGGTVVGTAIIDSTNLGSALVVASGAATVTAGASTSIGTVQQITDATSLTGSGFTTAASATNDLIQMSVGTDGATVSFQDLTTSTALTVTGAGAAGGTATFALSTSTFTLAATNADIDASGNFKLTATKAYTIQLSNGATFQISAAASLDTTNFGGSSGGTIQLANGVAAGATTTAITLNQGAFTGASNTETLTISVGGKAAELGALIAGYQSAGTITSTGGSAAGSNTQSISLSDGTAMDLTYNTAAIAGGTTATLTASSGTTDVNYTTSGLTFQVGADNTSNNQVNLNLSNKYTTTALGLGTGDLLTQAHAQTYINTAKIALNTLITQRADLGATQNQIGFIQANIANSIEQSMASVSSIRDTDMAAEMANFTKNKILTQAGTSMLAQANQAAQNILTLFR